MFRYQANGRICCLCEAAAPSEKQEKRPCLGPAKASAAQAGALCAAVAQAVVVVVHHIFSPPTRVKRLAETQASEGHTARVGFAAMVQSLRAQNQLRQAAGGLSRASRAAPRLPAPVRALSSGPHRACGFGRGRRGFARPRRGFILPISAACGSARHAGVTRLPHSHRPQPTRVRG